MHSTIQAKAFVEGVRNIDESLKKAKLLQVEIFEKDKTIRYTFICDKVVENPVKERVLDYLLQKTDRVFERVELNFKKVVTDVEILINSIYYFLKSNCPSITATFKKTDVSVSLADVQKKFSLKITPAMQKYLEVNGTHKKLQEYVNSNFCDDFICEFELREEDEVAEYGTSSKIELEQANERVIEIGEMELIDDLYMPKIATYIDDANEIGNYILCGELVSATERESKNGKPYLSLKIRDKSGERSGLYFSKKNTYSRIKRLNKGDEIVARVSCNLYNDKLSYTFEKINACKILPYELKAKPTLPVPESYKIIYPEPFEDVEEVSFLDEVRELPEEFKNLEFVVFDTETTGKVASMNAVIEIAAYKIKNGKIVERFATFVDPMINIPPIITEITHITDDDVRGQPKIFEIIPDLYKFIDGAILVAHNAEFDKNFIRSAMEPMNYDINNKILDTIEIAHEVFPDAPKYSLEELAKYSKIKYIPHRAINDALVTAKLFIKMIALKGKVF